MANSRFVSHPRPKEGWRIPAGSCQGWRCCTDQGLVRGFGVGIGGSPCSDPDPSMLFKETPTASTERCSAEIVRRTLRLQRDAAMAAFLREHAKLWGLFRLE